MNISENIGFNELFLLGGIALVMMGFGRFPDVAKAFVRTVGGFRREIRNEVRLAETAAHYERILRQVLTFSLLVITAFTAAYLLVVGL